MQLSKWVTPTRRLPTAHVLPACQRAGPPARVWHPHNRSFASASPRAFNSRSHLWRTGKQQRKSAHCRAPHSRRRVRARPQGSDTHCAASASYNLRSLACRITFSCDAICVISFLILAAVRTHTHTHASAAALPRSKAAVRDCHHVHGATHSASSRFTSSLDFPSPRWPCFSAHLAVCSTIFCLRGEHGR